MFFSKFLFIRLYGKERMEEMISIPETMFQPSHMRKLFFMDELLSTLTTEPLQQVDNNLVEAVGINRNYY